MTDSSSAIQDRLHGELNANGLSLAWEEAPWDTAIFGFPVLQISNMKVFDDTAEGALISFCNMLQRLKVGLVSCRIPHNCLRETMLLEKHGFRFIEMTYQPELNSLQARNVDKGFDLIVSVAKSEDLPALEELAGSAFYNERFHMDPRINSAMGNERYRRWVRSSLNHQSQKLYTVRDGAELVAFFVTELLSDGTCYWHLNAVAPSVQGQGYGKRAWLAMISEAKKTGCERIRTSIVARNHRVLNLYSQLGFRFPSPMMTFHWLKE